MFGRKMRPSRLWFSCGLAAAVLIMPVASSAGTLTDNRKSELSNLVRQDCGSCHGMTLQGGLGTSLLPHDLANTSSTELADIILDGVPGTPMPPWRGLLAEQEALWIAEQLKSGAVKRGNIQ